MDKTPRVFDWSFRYESAMPPLPREIGKRGPRLLKAGAHAIRVTPRVSSDVVLDGTLNYQGVLRVEDLEKGFRASGDLYRVREIESASRSDSQDGRLPRFPIEEYRYYFTLAAGAEVGPLLQLEVTRFDSKRRAWEQPVRLTATLTPADDNKVSGVLRNAAGTEVADVDAQWLAPHFREARFVIAAIKGLQYPSCPAPEKAFKDAYGQCGWSVRVECKELKGKPDQRWATRDLHDLLAKVTGELSRDDVWTSILLCVGHIGSGATLGMMFDPGDPVAREGSAIAALAKLPDGWRKVGGKALQDSGPPYTWTAVHEVAHTHNLTHDSSARGLMETIQTAATYREFPDQMPWLFSAADQAILRHAPDLWVRTGGLPSGHGFSRGVGEEDLRVRPEGLKLEVQAYDQVLRLGAPLRLHVVLRADADTEAPPSLEFKSGNVAGYLITPAGEERTFQPLMIQMKAAEPKGQLKKGEVLVQDLTLMGGPEGALMPSPGIYTVVVELVWHRRITKEKELAYAFYYLSAQTSVAVLPGAATDADVARKLLVDPQVMGALVFRSVKYEGGRKTIGEALDKKALSPHFELIAARFDAAKAKTPLEFTRAAALLTAKARVTLKEASDAFDEIYERAEEAQKRPALRRLLTRLLPKAQQFEGDPDLVRRIRAALGKRPVKATARKRSVKPKARKRPVESSART
jgi:hypothetical protein